MKAPEIDVVIIVTMYIYFRANKPINIAITKLINIQAKSGKNVQIVLLKNIYDDTKLIKNNCNL